MGLQITLDQGQGQAGGMWGADRRLWLTADQAEIVEDGDERAAFLFANEGYQVPIEMARRYGLAPVEPPPHEEERTTERVDRNLVPIPPTASADDQATDQPVTDNQDDAAAAKRRARKPRDKQREAALNKQQSDEGESK